MKKTLRTSVVDQQTIGFKGEAEQVGPERDLMMDIVTKKNKIKKCAVIDESHWDTADHMAVLRYARRRN